MSIVERALGKHRSPDGAAPEGPEVAAIADGPPPSGLAIRSDQALPLDPRRIAEAGYPTVGREQPTLTNQLRGVKQMLMERALARSGPGASPVIAVTSAVAGEGKSFISLNMALTLSLDRSLSVTLVDYDAIRPVTTKLFGAEGRAGLADILEGHAELSECVFPTDRPGLSIMPAGSETDGITDVLASAPVDALLSRLRATGPNHVFLFDCPPVLASNDARYLARRADLVVVVVRADATRHAWATEAVEKLGADANVVLLLNRRVGSALETYYGYGKLVEGYTRVK